MIRAVLVVVNKHIVSSASELQLQQTAVQDSVRANHATMKEILF